MNKVWLFLAATLLPNLLVGQMVIQGKVSDAITKMIIPEVLVISHDSIYSSTSDSSGRFKIKLPKEYRNSIIYSHPDYYPFREKIKKGSKMYPHFVSLSPRTLQLDTLFFKDNEQNKYVVIEVIEAKIREPIYMAEISFENNHVVGFTDLDGVARIYLPKEINSLQIGHPDYYTVQESVNLSKHRPGSDLKVALEKKNITLNDSIWMQKKNAISWAPGELLHGGIGIRYEHFIKTKHSIGLHSTFYLFGFVSPRPFYYNDTRFKGIKLAPFYRYYMKRNRHKSVFVEAKPLWGYFDFYKLALKNPNADYTKFYAETKTHTAGFAVAIGFTIVPNLNNLNLNLSLGYQYFPMNIEKEYEFDGSSYTYDDEWWYWGGPGSYVEIKFTVGGIF